MFSVSFISCSDDDDNENQTSVNFELYLDNSKQAMSSISNIEFNTTNVIGEPQLKAYLYGDDDSQFSAFTMTFDNVKLSDISVGDDLISKKGVTTYYMLIGDKGTYTMGNTMSDQNGNPIYIGYIGQALVKGLDMSNNRIDIEFKNVKLTNGKGDFINIKGRLNSVIDIE